MSRASDALLHRGRPRLLRGRERPRESQRRRLVQRAERLQRHRIGGFEAVHELVDQPRVALDEEGGVVSYVA